MNVDDYDAVIFGGGTDMSEFREGGFAKGRGETRDP